MSETINSASPFSLSGKHVAVTGAGGAIGRGISLALAQAGASVSCLDLNLESVSQLAQQLTSAGYAAAAYHYDATDWSAAVSTIGTVTDRSGEIDGLINNAGIYFASALDVLDEERHLHLLNVNMNGAFALTGAIATRFKAKRAGKIVNISSVAGREGFPYGASYAASKAGLIALTQSTAKELAGYNVNVNSLCPGFILTPLTKAATEQNAVNFGISPEEQTARKISQTPLQRLQDPADIGNAAVFLCSEAARNITGQTLNVCGGFQMR